MARPAKLDNIARRYINGSCVQTCEMMRYRVDGSVLGALPHDLELVTINPTDTGGRHISYKVTPIEPEKEPIVKARIDNHRRAIFVDGDYVEYVGSDEGWRKLIAQEG